MIHTTLLDDLHPAFAEALTASGKFELHDHSGCRASEVTDLLANTELLVVRSKVFIGKEVLDAAPKLKVIARAGAGTDNIDEAICRERNIWVLNAPEGNRRAVAEHVLGVTLNLLNRISNSHEEVALQGYWRRESNRGIELQGRTVGIIGYGNNGEETARLLSAFGCKVLAYDKYRSGFGDGYVEESNLHRIFDEAEVVSLHIPLTEETHGLVNADFLHRFQHRIWLVNAARGPIVVVRDLADAIHSGRVRGAALDVFEEEPPFNHPDFRELVYSGKVLFTPHVAGWTVESYKRISDVLAEKVLKWFN